MDQPHNIAFSYSKLKSFESCPRRYHALLTKEVTEEKNSHLVRGDQVHKAMAAALLGTALPLQFQIYQPWIDRMVATKGELLVEDQCKWACTKDRRPTPFFAHNVWMRSICDAVKYNPPVALIVDWKTGKSHNGDPAQLTLMSLMALIHFPKVHCIRSDFIWLEEDRNTTQIIYRDQAAHFWNEIMPRVGRLQQAHEEDNFPPLPGRFCKNYCPVISCEYCGRK